jgi:ribosomal protein L18E
MLFALKMIAKPAVNLIVDLMIIALTKLAEDTESKIDDALVETLTGEKENIKEILVAKIKEL